MDTRRYTFKLYENPQQRAVLDKHRMMVAELWNALLERAEYIQRTTVQRQVWYDTEGKRHAGISHHDDGSWRTFRLKQREDVVVPPKDGFPQRYDQYAMQAEITAMLNDPELREWRVPSVWCCHQTAAALDHAFKAFFRRAKEGAGGQSGYPKYKNRRKHNGIPHRFASGITLTKDPRHTRSWQLAIKGVPGSITARGLFPFDYTKLADADILWRDGRYWLSVCAQGEWERDHGDRPTVVKIHIR
jgi:hypothetical protein